MQKNKLRIFDSLAHPMLDDNFKPKGRDYSFTTLEKQMSEGSVKWACAVGLTDKGGYEHQAFIARCKSSTQKLYPIAAFNPEKLEQSIEKDLQHIKDLGFLAIKIHPGICKLDIASEATYKCFEYCEKIALPVFLCSYYYASGINANFYEKLYKLVTAFPKLKINIVHGGGVELLKFAELVRANENLLLDLSFTILKYSGSSIDQDIKFLFNNFDRRVCVGTDHPEFDAKQLEDKVLELGEALSQEKLENICFKNLASFLNLELDL